MKVLRVISFSCGALATCLASSLPVLAQQVRSDEHQVVVSAVVPDRRTIVVDAAQNILMVTSNTPKDVVPDVLLLTEQGPKVTFTTPLQYKYQQLMQQVGSNHVFVMTRSQDKFAGLFPNFINRNQQSVYNVVPVPNRDQQVATAYPVALGDIRDSFGTQTASPSQPNVLATINR